MRFAKDPSDGDDIMMPGGMATVVFDNVTGDDSDVGRVWITSVTWEVFG